MSAFSTRTSKRGSVVQIEPARRRLRPADAGSNRHRSADAVLTALMLVAVIGVISAIWLALVCASRGDYEAAALYPLWLLVPGTGPLLLCYLHRRRHPGRQPPPAMPLREYRNKPGRVRLRR